VSRSGSTAAFVDDPNENGRRTTTLLVGLLARASTLGVISGAQTVASMVAGLAALGRVASTTIEGQRMREALAAGRVGENLDLLFSRLGLGALASVSPPTPMLEDFYNDIALVMAPDVADVIDAALTGALVGSGLGVLRVAEPVDPIDFAIGFWTFSREVERTFDALADSVGPTAAPAVTVVRKDEPGAGRLLR
jgi:hypothetical protein